MSSVPITPIQVLSSYLSLTPPHWLKNSKPRQKGNARKGIIYENEAHIHLHKTLGNNYISSLWLVYKIPGEPHKWCQPDGLHFDILNGVITIYEMKLRHNGKAYKQLNNLYKPVVSTLFPQFSVRLVEVCSWYDLEVKLPRKHVMLADIRKAKVNDYSIHIWRKN